MSWISKVVRLLVSAWLAFAPALYCEPVQAAGYLALVQDPYACIGGGICTPSAGTVLSIYLIHSSWAGGAKGLLNISAPKPDCFAATYLSDTYVFESTFGNSQTELSVDYGSCLSEPGTHVLTIHYLIDGVTHPCCFYFVSGFAEVVLCDDTVEPIAVTLQAINPDPTCVSGHCDICMTPLPTKPSTWGAVKAMFY